MLVMIVPKGLSTGIIQSQIIEKAKAISKYQEVIVAMHSSQIEHFLSETNITLFKYEKFSEIKVLLRKDVIVYFRDVFSYLALFKFSLGFRRKFKTFYSFRALAHEESFYIYKSYIRKLILYLLELFVYSTTNYVGVVSEKMKLIICKKFYYKRNITVHPCCVSEANYIPKQNTQEIVSFVYVGGLSKWQMFDETIALFDKLFESISCNIELIIVTKDIAEAQRICKEKSKHRDKINYFSLNHSEVADLLKKCHFGFLLREKSIINETASPVKFLEYISNGVIPIMSDSIGDYSLMVKKENIGIILNPNNEMKIQVVEDALKDNLIQERLYNTAKKSTWTYLFENNSMDPLVNILN